MIAPLDLLAQRLHDVGDVLEVRIDRQRPAIGFERVFVVADLLQDETEAGQCAEMARLAHQHLANVGERVAVILLQVVDRGAPVPGFRIVGLELDDRVEQLDREVVILLVGRRL